LINDSVSIVQQSASREKYSALNEKERMSDKHSRKTFWEGVE